MCVCVCVCVCMYVCKHFGMVNIKLTLYFFKIHINIIFPALPKQVPPTTKL